MQTINKKTPMDVIFVIEQSPMIGSCFDQIQETYMKPLLKHFYGSPIFDDIGITKDLSGTVFSVVGYKSLDCAPLAVCTLIQPTSHVKLLYEKLSSTLEFSFGLGESRAHVAEGLATALDIFDDLEAKNARKRVTLARHLILIASQSACEDLVVNESHNYCGQLLEEVLQTLTEKQISLSIISPNYSAESVKLYERVNGSNGEFKLERSQKSGHNFFVLLHKSIQLVEESEVQQQTQQITFQQQMQQQQPPSSQNSFMNPLSNKAAENEQENINSISTASSSVNQQNAQFSSTSMNQQVSQNTSTIHNIQPNQQQQFQQGTQVT
jgi:hypothetical protein